MKGDRSHFWVGYADFMTLLMAVFLLIAISFMALLEKNNQARQQIIEDYGITRKLIYNDLVENFKDEVDVWDIEITPDLTIKFTNQEVLYKTGSFEITDKFRTILYDFIPRYLNILIKNEYLKDISEIRIEGHTDTVALSGRYDSYINNLELSQARAREVVNFIRSHNYFKQLPDTTKNYLTYLITANGLSFGRTLDKNKQYTVESKLDVANNLSRRVEFKLVTKSEELVEEIIKTLN